MSLTVGQKALKEFFVCNGAGIGADADAFIKAHSGDLTFNMNPATATIVHNSTGFTQDIAITLETADGERHRWYNGTITVSIADTSTAGTATITSTTVSMVDGKAVIRVTGNAAAWVASETATLTVAAATIMGYTVASKQSVITIS